MKKTSLKISDTVFKDAKAQSLKTGKTMSEIISQWAMMGRQILKQQSKAKVSRFMPVHLGKSKIDLTTRKKWMSELDKHK